MRSSLAAPLVLLFLVACTGSGASEAGHPVRRPSATTTGLRATSRSVARLAVPEGLEPWTVSAQGQVAVTEHEGRRVLRLAGEGERLVRVPLPEDMEPFHLVVVHGMFSERVRLEARVAGDAEPGAVSPERYTSVSTTRRQAVELAFPTVVDGGRVLELAVSGRPGILQLDELELVLRPPSDLLPEPERPGPVALDQEAREAFGVGVRFGARLELGEAASGDELLLAHGALPEAAVPGLGLHLRLREGRELVHEQRWPVLARGWSEARVALGPWTGRDLVLELEAFADPGADPDRVVLAVASPRVVRPVERPRTVLLITSDTHRGDHVGYAASGVTLATPHLDALAARGLAFLGAQATTNLTSPSHVTLMTGLHPREHRIVSNTMRMGATARTLAEAFREGGFATGAVVSVGHLGPDGTGLGQGFDTMHAPPGRPWRAESAVEHALSLLDGHAGQPLFLWLHVFDPHFPYEAPPPFAGRYYPADRDPFAGEPVDASLPAELAGLADLEYARAGYRAEIDYVDSQLGRVLLHPRVLAGVNAFTADHGEVLAREHSAFHHGELYPATLRVPLVLAFPGAPTGRTERPVDHLDLGRTLLDLAGLGRIEFPGRTLLGEGQEDAPRPLFALSGQGASASLTLDGLFLLLHLRDHRGPLGRPRLACTTELYDLRVDPACAHDLSTDRPEQRERLCRLLVEWLESPAAAGLASGDDARDEQELEALRALGYSTDAGGPGEAESWLPEGCRPCGG